MHGVTTACVRRDPAILPSQSLTLGCGLSLACNDCAPCGCLRGRVTVPGLPLCIFPGLPQCPFGSKAPRTGILSDSATDLHPQTRYTSLHSGLPHRLTVLSPLRDFAGFPSRLIPWAQRARPLNHTGNSPWYSARFSFPPQRLFYCGCHWIIVRDPLLFTRLAVPSGSAQPQR